MTKGYPAYNQSIDERVIGRSSAFVKFDIDESTPNPIIGDCSFNNKGRWPSKLARVDHNSKLDSRFCMDGVTVLPTVTIFKALEFRLQRDALHW